MARLLPWLKAKARRKGGGGGGGQPGGGGGGGVGPSVSGIYVSTAESSSNASTYTFSAQDLGTGNANRPVLVGVVCVGGGGAGLGTMTVDGINADPLCVEGQGTGVAEFFLARNVTDSTGDVVFVSGGSQTSCAIAVWRLTRDPLVVGADGGLVDLGVGQIMPAQVGGSIFVVGIEANKTAGTLELSNVANVRVAENNIESNVFYIAGDMVPDGTSETIDVVVSGAAIGDVNSPYVVLSLGTSLDNTTYPFEGTLCTSAFSLSRPLLRFANVGGLYTDSSGAITTLHNHVAGKTNLTDGGTSTRRPALATAGPNSIACADFDGSTDWLTGGTGYVAVGSKWIVMSAIFDTIDGTSRVLLGSGNSTMGIFALDSSGDKIWFQNNDGSADNANLAATAGTVYVISARHEGGQIFISLNGGSETVAVASGNTSALSNLTLGAFATAGTLPGDGKVFEVGTWSTVPSAPTRATIIANMMAHVGAV